MNNVKLMGRLTAEHELRYTQGGMQVAQFTLAVDRNLSKEKKLQAEAQGQPTADFLRCTAFGKSAEVIAEYVRKGNKFAVQGRIQTGFYLNKDNQRVYTTDIIVNSFEFVESARQQNTQQEQETEGFFPINNEDVPF